MRKASELNDVTQSWTGTELEFWCGYCGQDHDSVSGFCTNCRRCNSCCNCGDE